MLSGLAVLCLSGCGVFGDGGSCVAVPQDFSQSALIGSGTTVRAPIGTVLWVELVESANYSASPYPTSFPWLTPTSSDQNVLRAVRMCPDRGVYSLPVTITGFRAVGDGGASLLAKLAPPWRGRSRAIRNYQATVIVGH